MATLNENINAIKEVKENIKNALIAKNVDMAGVTFTGYPQKIEGLADSNVFEIKKLIVDGVTDEGTLTKELTIEEDGLLLYQLECYGNDHLTNSFKINEEEIAPVSTFNSNNCLNNLYSKNVVKNDIVNINNALSRFDYGNIVIAVYLIVPKKGITRYSINNKLITNNATLKSTTIINNAIIFGDTDNKTFTATEDSYLAIFSSGRHNNTLSAKAKINNVELEFINKETTARDKVTYLYFIPLATNDTIEMTFSVNSDRGNANCFIIANL